MTTAIKRVLAIHAAEQGSVLVIALVILLVLTMMAIAGVQSTSIQERMASNMRDKDISFQSAEAALRDAEHSLRNNFDTIKDEPCFYEYNDPLPGTNPNFCDYFIDTLFPNTPQFYIYQLPPPPPDDILSDGPIPDPKVDGLYRIFSKSVGGSVNAVTNLESVYKK